MDVGFPGCYYTSIGREEPFEEAIRVAFVEETCPNAVIWQKVQHAVDKDEDHGDGVSSFASFFAVYRKNWFPRFPRVSQEVLSVDYLEELTST